MEKLFVIRGVLQYPHLNQPDDRFGASTAAFKSDVICTGDKYGQLLEQISDAVEQYAGSDEVLQKTKGRKARIHPDGIPIVDNGDGTYKVRVKNAVYEDKETRLQWSFPIAFFAQDKMPLGTVKLEEGVLKNEGVPSIGSGTKAAVQVEARFWLVSGKVGVTLRPRAIQIVELVEYTGGMPDASVFDDGEDEDFVSVSSSSEGVIDDDDF
jgi:hypothetical protein